MDTQNIPDKAEGTRIPPGTPWPNLVITKKQQDQNQEENKRPAAKTKSWSKTESLIYCICQCKPSFMHLSLLSMKRDRQAGIVAFPGIPLS